MSRILLSACTLALLAIVIPTAGAACTTPDLQRIIPKFEAKEVSSVQAILLLGQQEHICFGLRNLPKQSFVKTKTILFENKSLNQILTGLMGDDHVEIIDSNEGIIYLFVPSTSTSLYDYMLPLFRTGRISLQTASFSLEIHLDSEINPSNTGFAGSYPTGDSTDVIGPFDVANQTVTQLLNKIVGESKGAVWIATRPDKLAVHINNLWRIIQYDRPVTDYFPLITAIGANYDQVQQKEPTKR